MTLYEAAREFSIRARMHGLQWESIENLRKAIADHEHAAMKTEARKEKP